MKKSIINEVFTEYRELLPVTSDIREKARTSSEAYNELVKPLSPEQLKYHKAFADASEDEYLKEIDFNFVEGFKLGLLIGIECAEV